MEKIKKDNRGRKPISDKKKPVTVYVQESIIKHHGIDNLKNKMLDFIKIKNA